MALFRLRPIGVRVCETTLTAALRIDIAMKVAAMREVNELLGDDPGAEGAADAAGLYKLNSVYP